MLLIQLFVSALIAKGVRAATSTFQWETSYVTAAPNGVSRPVIGVNGQWPPPAITVSKGDEVVIQVKNSLNDGEYLTLHTHGIFQNGSNYMDGVDQVTQWYFKSIPFDISGIPPGDTFDYCFSTGNQTGTYWIHSHIKGQYPNGIRAPFVILDPETPYDYVDQRILSVSDWVPKSSRAG
jgi:iron transport multicopper oxidase